MWALSSMAFKLTYSDGQESQHDDGTVWELDDGVLKLGREEGKWEVLLSPSHWAVLEIGGAKSPDKAADDDSKDSDDSDSDDSDSDDSDSDSDSDSDDSDSDSDSDSDGKDEKAKDDEKKDD